MQYLKISLYIKVVILLIATSSLVLAQAPDTLWTKTISGDDTDLGFSVQQTFDGGYIIAGYTDSYGAGNLDMYLIRIGPDGLTSDDSLALAYNGNRHLVRQPNTGNMHLVYTSGGNIVYVSSTNYGVDWTLPYTLGIGEFPAIALTPLGKPSSVRCYRKTGEEYFSWKSRRCHEIAVGQY